MKTAYDFLKENGLVRDISGGVSAYGIEVVPSVNYYGLLNAMNSFAAYVASNREHDAKFWEDAHARLEENLRTQYDAEFEAFKKSYTDRNEQYKLISDQHISEQVKQLDERDASIKNILRVNEQLNEEIKSLVAQSRYMTAEMKGWKERWESAVIEGDLLRTKNEELQEGLLEYQNDYQDICELAGQLAIPIERESLMEAVGRENYERFKNHIGW